MQRLLTASLLVLCACSEGPAPEVLALREHVTQVAARPEHDTGEIQVQHILIAFQGADQSRQPRFQSEAEVLTASLRARIAGGEPLSELSVEYSDDPGPGTYRMHDPSKPGGDLRSGTARKQMTPGFADVGWRLEVGEVGVCAYDRTQSPYGWHIIQRLR
ncbi:MAG: peptidylprolyl isomerase [Planctomycetota bacterium]|nr:peptidylprolyl isomerase [Planctomycetota bacterium]